MRPVAGAAWAVAGSLIALASHSAAGLPPGVQLQHRMTMAEYPVALRISPDGRLFYLELETGRIMVAHVDGGAARPWAQVPTFADHTRGLLGLAIHPDFPDSPYVYVFHTHPDPIANCIARLADSAGVGTKYTRLLDGLPAADLVHNGGRLDFGPDGMLYVTYGDQQLDASAQDPARLEGKILRLGSGGRPAPGNPYGPDNPAAVIGVRNAFGLCFDRVSGRGYFTDNGDACDDEVNLLLISGNYGWGIGAPCGVTPDGTVEPIVRYTPTIAPTGCWVYRGDVYGGWLDGDLLFGGYNTRELIRIRFEAGDPTQIDTLETLYTDGFDPVLDVTQGSDDHVWFLTRRSVFRIAPVPPLAVEDGGVRRGPAVAPNPFTGATTIALPPGHGWDRLEVFDASGRLVRAWRPIGAERLAWDGRDQSGRDAPPGLYLARASGPEGTAVRRVVRMRR